MVQRIDVETNAVDSGQTTSSSIDFAGELLDLDMEFADAALMEFHYSADGTDGSGNLTNPQHDSADDKALWDLGTINAQITGLSADTQYHYKIVGETVTYNSSTSMDNAATSQGFLNGLANNSTEIDKVLNNDTALNSILNSNIALNILSIMDKITDDSSVLDYVFSNNFTVNLLFSNYIIDTMWSKEKASYDFWESSVVNLNQNDSYTGVQVDLDLSSVQNLKVECRSYAGYKIFIGGSKVLEKSPSNQEWATEIIDVSSFSGITTIELSSIHNDTGYNEFSYVDAPQGTGKGVRLDRSGYDPFADFANLRLE